MLADRLHIRSIRKERAHHVLTTLGMQPEIVKRIGVATFDDRIGLGGQFGHAASSVSSKMRIAPVSGTRTHSGRCANSYSIS